MPKNSYLNAIKMAKLSVHQILIILNFHLTEHLFGPQDEDPDLVKKSLANYVINPYKYLDRPVKLEANAVSYNTFMPKVYWRRIYFANEPDVSYMYPSHFVLEDGSILDLASFAKQYQEAIIPKLNSIMARLGESKMLLASCFSDADQVFSGNRFESYKGPRSCILLIPQSYFQFVAGDPSQTIELTEQTLETKATTKSSKTCTESHAATTGGNPLEKHSPPSENIRKTYQRSVASHTRQIQKNYFLSKSEQLEKLYCSQQFTKDGEFLPLIIHGNSCFIIMNEHGKKLTNDDQAFIDDFCKQAEDIVDKVTTYTEGNYNIIELTVPQEIIEEFNEYQTCSLETFLTANEFYDLICDIRFLQHCEAEINENSEIIHYASYSNWLWKPLQGPVTNFVTPYLYIYECRQKPICHMSPKTRENSDLQQIIAEIDSIELDNPEMQQLQQLFRESNHEKFPLLIPEPLMREIDSMGKAIDNQARSIRIGTMLSEQYDIMSAKFQKNTPHTQQRTQAPTLNTKSTNEKAIINANEKQEQVVSIYRQPDHIDDDTTCSSEGVFHISFKLSTLKNNIYRSSISQHWYWKIVGDSTESVVAYPVLNLDPSNPVDDLYDDITVNNETHYLLNSEKFTQFKMQLCTKISESESIDSNLRLELFNYIHNCQEAKDINTLTLIELQIDIMEHIKQAQHLPKQQKTELAEYIRQCAIPHLCLPWELFAMIIIPDSYINKDIMPDHTTMTEQTSEQWKQFFDDVNRQRLIHLSKFNTMVDGESLLENPSGSLLATPSGHGIYLIAGPIVLHQITQTNHQVQYLRMVVDNRNALRYQHQQQAKLSTPKPVRSHPLSPCVDSLETTAMPNSSAEQRGVKVNIKSVPSASGTSAFQPFIFDLNGESVEESMHPGGNDLNVAAEKLQRAMELNRQAHVTAEANLMQQYMTEISTMSAGHEPQHDDISGHWAFRRGTQTPNSPTHEHGKPFKATHTRPQAANYSEYIQKQPTPFWAMDATQQAEQHLLEQAIENSLMDLQQASDTDDDIQAEIARAMEQTIGTHEDSRYSQLRESQDTVNDDYTKEQLRESQGVADDLDQIDEDLELARALALSLEDSANESYDDQADTPVILKLC